MHEFTLCSHVEYDCPACLEKVTRVPQSCLEVVFPDATEEFYAVILPNQADSLGHSKELTKKYQCSLVQIQSPFMLSGLWIPRVLSLLVGLFVSPSASS